MNWTKIQRNLSIGGSIATIGTALVKIIYVVSNANINMTTNECFLWLVSLVFGTGLSIFFWLNARIDTLAKKVSQDYDNEHWSPAEQKQNVFHVLRNDDLKTLSGETDAVNQELKTLKEVKLTEIEKKITHNFNALYNITERQRETIDALKKKLPDDVD